MSIAPTKSQALYIGRDNSKREYFINGVRVPAEDCVRDLGVLIDSKLSFKQHISKIIRNAYFKAHQLFRVLSTKNTKQWILAYKSYVRPQLEYCTEIWSPEPDFGGKGEILRIERVQKYFTRRVFKRCNIEKVSYKKRMEALDLDTLELRRMVNDLTMVYKIFTKRTPIHPTNFFILSSFLARETIR